MNGYTKQHRDRFDHKLFRSEKWCRGYAWDWMVSQAMWQDKEADVKGHSVTIKRGQFYTSIRHMADVFGWSRSAVDRFITRLKTEQMIGTDTGTGQLVITICNYAIYQDGESRAGTEGGTQTGTAAGQKEESKEINKKFVSDTDFQKFWDTFPHRHGKKQKRSTCEAKYRRALKAGVPAQAILSAAEAYRNDPDVRRGYGRAAETWLNQKGWEDERAEAPVDPDILRWRAMAEGRRPPSENSDEQMERWKRIAAQ